MSRYFSPYELGVFDEATHVVVMQAFFDASERGDFLVVGGYMFRKRHIKPFEKRWNAMLRKYNLEYFHMTDCNVAAGVHSHLSHQDCDDCARMAIQIITEYATVGITSGVDIPAFNDLIVQSGYMKSPFSISVHSAMMMCKDWAEQNDPSARIFYVFEAGDQFQSDANQILTAISEDPVRRKFFFYEDHAFLTKKGSKPTQAADIVAWHTRKQYEREARCELRLRGDFAALVDGVMTKRYFHSADELRKIKAIANKLIPSNHGERIAGLALRSTNASSKGIDREVLAILLEGG